MEGEGNFIFRKSGDNSQNINQTTMVNFFRNKGSLLEILGLINKDLKFLKNIKIALFDTILANLEINIFVFSFILNILFLLFGNPIFLSIETIFIFGIFPSLLNIFKAFIAKFGSLISCLFFTYLVIYIYNWLSIFYLRNGFDFGEVMQYQSAQFITEPFCHSSIQCYLVLISYGTRSGGGIGDKLPVVSYKNDTNMFISRFFFDMTFYVFVIMIMGNVTFGLIVDSFGALRDETYNYDYDKNNICFICQMSKDDCLLNNIDFDNHINNDHNIWNYVYFLCYLHLYDSNNFSRLEGFVWDKLIENDYGWIPLNKDEEGGEEEN
jgi:inositol 1,4,5-triphosphate receptor type 3